VADNKKLSQLRKEKKELQEKDVSNTTMHDFSKRIRDEERINDLIEDRIDLNKKILKDEEEYLDTLESVTGKLGKNSEYAKEFKKQQDQLKIQTIIKI
jgi:hypothetical protein